MQRTADRKLVFENGTVLPGTGFGAAAQTAGEAVFNTSMVGYQEILSDPGYCGRIVCMTYPLIGNYGMADEDYESRVPRIRGMAVREYSDSLANFRAAKTLSEAMEEYGIPGISGIDTRMVARMLRREGTMRALMCGAEMKDGDALEALRAAPADTGLARGLSCAKKWYARAAGVRHNVVAVDCGIRNSAVKSFVRRQCNVTVVPCATAAAEILALAPDGLFVSGGPGDPAELPEVIALVRELRGKLPIFGVSLGCQLIALAAGARTYKMKLGHHGANHPVKNLCSGRIETAAQNHGYAVDAQSLAAAGLRMTHQNLLDGTAEGVSDAGGGMFGVQYHPETCPGAQNAPCVYDDFVRMMRGFRTGGGLHA